MALSDKDKALLADEHFDPRKVILGCPIHKYYGPTVAKHVPGVMKKNPTLMSLSCKTCWMVYYTVALSMIPPTDRAQRLEEMTEIVSDMNQAYEKGKWDFTPLAHPEVAFED